MLAAIECPKTDDDKRTMERDRSSRVYLLRYVYYVSERWPLVAHRLFFQRFLDGYRGVFLLVSILCVSVLLMPRQLVLQD